MIDYITATFPCQHDPFGDILQFVSVETGKKRVSRKKVILECSSARLTVRSIRRGQYLVISGNPAKFLQEHNIFGSNDLRGVCYDLFEMVTEQLGLRVSQEDRCAVRQGHFSLSRVDIAVNYRLPHRADVPRAIREIAWQWLGQDKDLSTYAGQTVYLNQRSASSTLKFYDKRQELKAHPLPPTIVGREKLLKYAERLLRAELTLRSPALKRLGLDKGAGWSVSRAKQLVQQKVEAAGIGGEITRVLMGDEYEGLPLRLKQVYWLWERGADLEVMYEGRTLLRHRKALAERGVNIRQPPPKQRTVRIRLEEHLVPGNMATFPLFAKRLRLIHLPAKPRQGKGGRTLLRLITRVAKKS